MGFNGNIGFVSALNRLKINVSEEEINLSNSYGTTGRYCLKLVDIDEFYKGIINNSGNNIVETTPNIMEAWSNDNINILFQKAKELSFINFVIRIIDKNE